MWIYVEEGGGGWALASWLYKFSYSCSCFCSCCFGFVHPFAFLYFVDKTCERTEPISQIIFSLLSPIFISTSEYSPLTVNINILCFWAFRISPSVSLTIFGAKFLWRRMQCMSNTTNHHHKILCYLCTSNTSVGLNEWVKEAMRTSTTKRTAMSTWMYTKKMCFFSLSSSLSKKSSRKKNLPTHTEVENEQKNSRNGLPRNVDQHLIYHTNLLSQTKNKTVKNNIYMLSTHYSTPCCKLSSKISAHWTMFMYCAPCFLYCFVLTHTALDDI